MSNLTSQWALTESHFLWLNTGQTDRMKRESLHSGKPVKSWACQSLGFGTGSDRVGACDTLSVNWFKTEAGSNLALMTFEKAK